MGEIKLFRADQFDDLIDTLNTSFQSHLGYVLVLDQPLPDKQAKALQEHPGLVCLATRSPKWQGQWPLYIQGFCDNPHDKDQLLWSLESARRFLDLRHENQQLRFRFSVEGEKLDSVLASALEISEEREPLKLCDKILSIMRKQLRSEGASLYLAEPESNQMRFIHVQNERVKTSFESFTLRIDDTSMAGACAHRKKILHLPDVRNIPRSETFKFNDSFDKKTGYTTRSLLCIPLIKSKGDLVGVVQLINSKRETGFTQEDIEIGRVLAAPIAASLETALLYQDIEKLFEGFVRASIVAIESRDPATSGHSDRVALYTVNLAQKVSESTAKEFSELKFSDQSLKQIRYAALLHDFGKIGVPEKVLQKEKKLYPNELYQLMERARLVRLAHPSFGPDMDDFVNLILKVNEPTVVVQDAGTELHRFMDKSFDVLGEKIHLLTDEEFKKLSLQKGSLTIEDRAEIESHVEHTFKFLSKIPWTRELRQVPEIAYAHHEKLDGTGYPRKISQPSIPVESQMMAIADIYDALTAPDRPYKKSVPIPRALDILMDDATKGKINKELVRLFIDQNAYMIKKD